MKGFCMRVARRYVDDVRFVDDCWSLLFNWDCWDWCAGDALIWLGMAALLAALTPVVYLAVAPVEAVCHGFSSEED